MSILDTFFILFESDASKLDKGLQESQKKAKGLERDLTEAEKAAHDLGSSIGQTIRELGGLVLATLTIHEMGRAILDAASHADKLDETAERLGVNIEALSAWGDLTKKSGGSVEAFAGSIEALNKGLSMLEITGKSRVAPFLQELGIDMDAAANKGKNAFDFLPMIAEAMEGMDRQKSTAIGQKLGLDQGTIMTLQQGRREVEALLLKERELGVVTKEQGQIAAKFKDQQDDTAHAFRSMWAAVATTVLPAITAVLKAMEGLALFMREHSDFIVGLMIAIGTAIAVFVVPSLLAAAAAAIVAFAPFLLIGAAVVALGTAFALLYDDVMNFVDGNDSLIGQMLDKYPVIGSIVEGIVSVFKSLGDVVMWAGETLVSVGEIGFEMTRRLIGGLIELATWFGEVTGWTGAFKGAFQVMAYVIGGLWDFLYSKAAGFAEIINVIVGVLKGMGGLVTTGLGAAKNLLGIGGSSTGDAVALGQQTLAGTNNPLAATSSSAINNSRGGDKSNSVTVGQVVVQTQATDAAGIAASVGGSLKSEMQSTVNQFDNGVAM